MRSPSRRDRGARGSRRRCSRCARGTRSAGRVRAELQPQPHGVRRRLARPTPPSSATASHPSRSRRSLIARHQGGLASSEQPRCACQRMNDSAARRNGRWRAPGRSVEQLGPQGEARGSLLAGGGDAGGGECEGVRPRGRFHALHPSPKLFLQRLTTSQTLKPRIVLLSPRRPPAPSTSAAAPDQRGGHSFFSSCRVPRAAASRRPRAVLRSRTRRRGTRRGGWGTRSPPARAAKRSRPPCAGEHAGGLLAHRDHDPRRGRGQRGHVGAVVGDLVRELGGRTLPAG